LALPGFSSRDFSAIDWSLTKRSKVDIVPLVLTQQLTLWFRDLEDGMQTPPVDGQEHDLEESFALYRKAGKLIDMGNAFSQ
jgi:hypothetical protein